MKRQPFTKADRRDMERRVDRLRKALPTHYTAALMAADAGLEPDRYKIRRVMSGRLYAGDAALLDRMEAAAGITNTVKP